jgi:hypothetical protein
MAKNLIKSCGLRRSSVPVLAVAAVLLIACGSASTGEGGETGLHVALVIPQDGMAEVTGVFFEVTNDLGEMREALFSLEEEPFLCLLDRGFEGHACTDWLVRLEPGDYMVVATPLKTGGSPSELFAVARGGTSVLPGMTTELVLTGPRIHRTK